jgi:predicted RecA/RadA family phage recombinase
MTSLDGITWTIRAAANDNAWRAVAFGNGRYVAVSNNGVGNRIMTSEDGFNWTLVNSPADNSWEGICYGNGLFVAVASSGTGNRVMTSPDGLSWTIRNSASDNNWINVVYGNGLFVAVANTGTGDRVMTSTDGITWTSGASAADNAWNCVAYGDGKFVAVSGSGTGNRVMTNSHQVVRNTPVIDSITVVSAVVSIHFNGNYTSALPAGVDTSAISNIEYSLDNGATWSTPTPEVTTSPLTLTNLPSGEHQVKIRSLNSTGTSCVSTDSFKISIKKKQ